MNGAQIDLFVICCEPVYLFFSFFFGGGVDMLAIWVVDHTFYRYIWGWGKKIIKPWPEGDDCDGKRLNFPHEDNDGE